MMLAGSFAPKLFLTKSHRVFSTRPEYWSVSRGVAWYSTSTVVQIVDIGPQLSVIGQKEESVGNLVGIHIDFARFKERVGSFDDTFSGELTLFVHSD